MEAPINETLEREQRILKLQCEFIDNLHQVGHLIHEVTCSHGLWPADKLSRSDRDVIEKIQHDLETISRDLAAGNPPHKRLNDFSSVEVQLANILIRIMDLAAARRWRLGQVVIARILDAMLHRH